MITFIILISCIIGAIQLHIRSKPNRKYTVPNAIYEKEVLQKRKNKI